MKKTGVTTTYLTPDEDELNATISRLPEEGFVMLALFRLRDAPDYTDFPALKPETPATCRELFDQYVREIDVIRNGHGVEAVYSADGGGHLVGPANERWDIIQLVRYPTRDAFLRLTSDEALRKHVPLRAITVEDSRLLPTFPVKQGSVDG